MKIFDFSVKRPVAVTMIIAIVVALGVISLSRLGLDLFPEMEMPVLLLRTGYSGVSPLEIEEQITRPLEAVVGTIGGVENIISISSRGSSMVILQFAWGSDLNYASYQLRDRLDLMGNALPADATKPTVIKMDPNSLPIMSVAISGDATLEELTDYADAQILPGLERIDGVASVSMSGAVTEEISVVIDPQRLQAYGVSMSQIMGVLRQENANFSAGSVEEGMLNHAVRVVGEFSSIEDIRNLQIQSAYGGFLPLHFLATVERTVQERNSYVFINGKPGISMSLMKSSDANLVQTSARVREFLDAIEADMPESYEFSIAFDQADYVNMSLNNVVSSGLQGAALAVLILILFLRSWRSTLIIAISIPVSVITAFAFMFFTDVTLNMVSLGGLALGIGMMVDNSIVILENIFRYRQEGADSLEAAIKGGKEVAGAVIASTVTTIVVFVPIVFVEGIASQIFGQMALTITCSLLASLGVAFLTVPMLSNKLLIKEKANKDGGRFFRALKDKYSRFLAWSLRRRAFVVLFFALAFAGSVFLFRFVGMEFIPAQDTGTFNVDITLPRGVPLRESLRVAAEVEGILLEIPENERLVNNVGSSVSFSGTLIPLEERVRSMDEILDEIRGRLENIPGIEYTVSSSGGTMMLMMMAGGDITVNLLGDDRTQLEILANAVASRIELIDGARD
ncbi:MAG: efflux RND transporter permease subunit, partial [Clostridiales bacterium]|nr:efflux RND transporter permease subunit [Clostridiales bacterium]